MNTPKITKQVMKKQSSNALCRSLVLMALNLDSMGSQGFLDALALACATIGELMDRGVTWGQIAASYNTELQNYITEQDVA
jgi:hypothetical protein